MQRMHFLWQDVFSLCWHGFNILGWMGFGSIICWRKKKRKKEKHITKDMVDFVDEKVIPFGELDDDERIVCRFLGDLLCALVCLIPSLIAMMV